VASNLLPVRSGENLPLPSGRSWLGAMVPKKWARRAVTRNLIKRQVYSVSIDFESAMPVFAYLVRLRAGFDTGRFVSASSPALKAALREELHLLFSAREVARP
jgi:ribonuclease P protein component